MKRINLGGKWEFRRADGKWEVWLPAKVPGCVHTDLMANGLLDDPFYGTNELEVLWIDTANWEYRRKFHIPQSLLEEERQQIVFEGLDTVAEIHLNGGLIGKANNMFRRWPLDVTGRLHPGENELRVVFTGPVAEGRRLARVFGQLPGGVYHWGTGRTRLTGRNYIRKAQYQFGWDWGPLLATCGIWRPVNLVVFSGPKIEYVTHRQVHHRNGWVTVTVHIRIETPVAARGTVEVDVGNESSRMPFELVRGRHALEVDLRLPFPRLWWPAGSGEQWLYPLSVRLRDEHGRLFDEVHQRIGLRQVELVRRPDSEGESFFFRINGQAIYAKGANWIPADIFPTRVTLQHYQNLLEQAVKANMNMLRVWGGGIYEHDEFYNLCDQLGIMIWHDHMFACAAYPATAEFLKNVSGEIEHQVLRLSHHPCIVLWCGNNENEQGMVEWWGKEPNITKLRLDYRRLTKRCELVTRRADPDRPWWPSSPSSGGDLETPNSLSKGDSHFWEVWHRGAPFSRYLEIRPRFQSEFGFQSFPGLRTLRAVLGPEDLNLTSPVMEHHQRSGIGNTVIVETVCRYFRLPQRLDDLFYLSQLVQAMAIQTGVEHWRRIKPFCMGTLYWQLNDCWPVASWSSIDYAGRPKALHYAARRFYAPLLVSVCESGGKLQLWLTSDLRHAVSGRWCVELWDYEGRLLQRWKGSADLRANQSRCVARWPTRRLAGDFDERNARFLYMKWSTAEGGVENVHFFAPLKRAELPRPSIRIDVESRGECMTLKLCSNAVALFVELAADSLEGEWSDNYFHLLPRRPKRVRFGPLRPVAKSELLKRLKVRTLRDTY
ncbi:MAG: glycoside hydrolase family 2 protein [Kiritimatiellae bacterium]|nr:glycoside hydrolase family 2 protein [Kiritimatiellia bacterium]